MTCVFGGAPQPLDPTSSPVFEDVTITGLVGNVIPSPSVELSIEALDNAIYEMADSGFVAWTSGIDANTYTIAAGKFQIDRSGRGKIRGKEIAWVSGQQTGVLAANAGYVIYIDSSGLLQSTTNPAIASFSGTIRLFHVLYDGTNYIVTKEDHPAAWDAGVCLFLHLTINVIIRGIGAIVTRVALGTGADPDDRRIKTVGDDTLDDHGLTTAIPATNPCTWQVFIRNAGGNWVLSSIQSDLPISYNNAGAPTALDAVNAFGIYVLYVAQDDIEVSTPQFFAVMGETSYPTLVAAQAAISTGSLVFVSNELKTLEPCQLGYAIVQYSVTGGYIEELVVAKQTFSQTLIGGVASGSHNLLTDLDYASAGHTGFAGTVDISDHAALTTGVHGAGASTLATAADIAAHGVLNKGRWWIAHGDNVITLPNAQADANFLSEASIHLPSMGGVTTRGPTHTNPMTITTKPDTVSRLLVRLHGGFGFTSGGPGTGLTERFDDVADTQTARTAATAREGLAGYSLNGFGFTSCGIAGGNTGVTQRFDDVANTQTARTAATARRYLAGYSTNEYFVNFVTEDV